MFIFPGNFDLDRVGEILDTRFESENRTISGYIVEQLEDIPEAGRELDAEGLHFVVTRVSRKKVLEVEVRKAT